MYWKDMQWNKADVKCTLACAAQLTQAAFSLSGRWSYKAVYDADEQNSTEILTPPETSMNITMTVRRSR